ncbi:MAG: hypothetical protein J5I91_06620 [Bacteroidetes bacterium]|nr:hypothetical protein [Bacteroidota bacterium]
MGLLRTLFYAVIIYYAWKILKNMFTIKPPTNNVPPPQDNNSVNNNKNTTKTDEEYIDYEEIK